MKNSTVNNVSTGLPFRMRGGNLYCIARSIACWARSGAIGVIGSTSCTDPDRDLSTSVLTGAAWMVEPFGYIRPSTGGKWIAAASAGLVLYQLGAGFAGDASAGAMNEASS